jgi:hypothetical protein
VSFPEFLKAQRGAGAHDSEGEFRLDARSAVAHLAKFQLPSENHYLLKLVQVASRLEAETIQFSLRGFRWEARFRAAEAGQAWDMEALARAFSAPTASGDALLGDLVAGLRGCFQRKAQEVQWSVTQGHRGRRVLLGAASMQLEDFTADRPLGTDQAPCGFLLSVRHPRRFFDRPPDSGRAAGLLLRACGFSRVRIVVDGHELERFGSDCYTRHREKPPTLFSSASRPPYCAVLYELAGRDEGFELPRPHETQYAFHGGSLNVWSPALRDGNTLLPDGTTAPAWILFFREGEQGLDMRAVARRARCRFVLAYDRRQAAEGAPLLLALVRQSVRVGVDLGGSRWKAELAPWCGFHLILDDSGLPTDLTGFQVLAEEALSRLLADLSRQRELLRATVEEARSSMAGW